MTAMNHRQPVSIHVVIALSLSFAGMCVHAQTDTAVTSKAEPSSPTPSEPDSKSQQQCVALIAKGRFDEARELAKSFVAQHPKSSQSHLLLALTYHKQRKYEQAEPLLEKAIALDEDHNPPKMFLGWCRYYLGKQKEAEQSFLAYLPTNPDYPDIHFALGLIAYERDDLEEAMTRFDRAIKLASQQRRATDEAKSRARRADILIRQNKLEEARDELTTAIRLNPRLYGAMYKLSRVFHRMGDKESAKKAKAMHDTVREKLHPTKGHPE